MNEYYEEDVHELQEWLALPFILLIGLIFICIGLAMRLWEWVMDE